MLEIQEIDVDISTAYLLRSEEIKADDTSINSRYRHCLLLRMTPIVIEPSWSLVWSLVSVSVLPVVVLIGRWGR